MKFAYCRVSIAPIRREKSDPSEMISQLLFGELIEILEIDNNWTKIRTYFDNYEGWIDSKQFILLSEKELKRHLDGVTILKEESAVLNCPWGRQTIVRGSFISNSSEFNIGKDKFSLNLDVKKEFQSKINFALSYLNTPYLWGGKTPFGIDCSGFTQQIFRFEDINLPRDAYQQAELGLEISFSESMEGDLAFFTNMDGKIIHVGILLKNNEIIHASGWVRIDLLRENGIFKKDSGEKSHDLFVIKRF